MDKAFSPRAKINNSSLNELESEAAMRKLKYHVATTVDGYIGHEDHTVEGFIQEGDHANEYLESLKNDYDTVLMGRKTYEFGLQFGVTSPYPWLKQYVISSSLQVSPDEHVELISSDPAELVRRLKQKPGKDIYLCGGASLASSLLAADLIDQVVLKVNPVLFGTGIPLFRNMAGIVPLRLEQCKTYSNGVLLVQYEVIKTV